MSPLMRFIRVESLRLGEKHFQGHDSLYLSHPVFSGFEELKENGN